MTETEKSLIAIPDLLLEDWHARESGLDAVIKGTKSVLLIGTGSSHHVALWGAWFFDTLAGIRAQTLTTWDYLASSFEPQKDELVILISHRGKSGLTEKALKKLGKHKKVVLLANEEANVKGFAHIKGSSKETSQAHTKSLIGAMASVSEIGAHLVEHKFADKIIEHRQVTGEMLASMAKVFRKREKMPLPKNFERMTCVGGGFFHPIALEVALKAREMAKISAVGMGLEEVLHGPMAALTKSDLVMVIPPLSAPASELRHYLYIDRLSELMQKLEKTKAQVIVPHFDEEMHEAAQELHPVWQAVLYLYTGQWMCLRLAQARDENPDANPFL